MLRFYTIILISILALPVAALAAPVLDADDKARLQRVKKLVKTGASQLAQALVDAYQPPEQWIDSWMLWEAQRLRILKKRGDWKAILERSNALPKEVDDGFRHFVWERAADASLRLGQADAARVYLRKLLFSKPLVDARGKPLKNPKQHKKDVARWRRMVIRSYLRDGRSNDARLALAQYIADYNPHNPSWSVLQARVQMLGKHYDEAYETLSGVDRYESRLLQQLAALRGNLVPAKKVMAKVKSYQKRLKPGSMLYLQSYSLLAESARAAKQGWSRVAAMETLLQSTEGNAFKDEVYQSVDGDNLWAAYRSSAERWGNTKRLLVGDDTAWLKAAKRSEKKSPLRARAIYALVVMTGEARAKNKALDSYIDACITHEKDKLLFALFSGKQFEDLSALPAAARYTLAEYALQRRHVRMAGRMIEGLNVVPKGKKSDVVWPLRRARILLYAGRHDAAVSTLRAFIDSQKLIAIEPAEMTANVIFDMQAIERHKEAIILLELMQPKVKDKDVKRKLYFWMADSYKAIGEKAQAAELYLRSAYHGQPGGGDHWGQTARFHAAEILAEGGLIEDSRYVYGRLLRGTKDGRRRSMLQQRIEQLWLYESKQNDTPFLSTPQ
ncbi:MAG: hypothetical protein IME93_00205 [Proteobacteria bacterium]|nr:hypothetical protein [Pseudomonadota bacterium]